MNKVTTLHIKLAIAFVALNVLDAALSLTAIGKGGYELFPIARHILEQPTWVFWGFKIGMALIFTLVLLILSKRFPRQIKRIFIALVGVMLGVCLINMVGLLL